MFAGLATPLPEVLIMDVWGVATGAALLVGVAPPWKLAAGGPRGRFERIIFGTNFYYN